MNLPIRTWSLGRNLIAAMVLILGIALLAERFYEYGIIYARQVEDTQLSNVREKAYTLSLDIEAALNSGKEELVAQQINALGVLADLHLLALTDENGRILHATRLALVGQMLSKQDPVFSEETFQLTAQGQRVQAMLSPDRMSAIAYAPVALPGHRGELRSLRTGVLFIHYDLARLKAKGWELQAHPDTLLRWGLVLIVIVLLLNLLLRRMLFTPLAHLQQVAQEFALGNLHSKAQLSGKSELANLGEVYNRMAHSIQGHIHSLEESETKFRTLVENFPGVVYRCALDKDWTVEYISEGIETLSGYPASDFLSSGVRSYASIIHSADVARVDHVVQEAVAQNQPYIIEYRIVRADGTIRWVWERGMAQRDETAAVKHLDGAIFDITDRRLAEEQVRKLSLAVQQSPNSIVITDLEARIEYVNDTFVQVTGFSREEVLGQNPRILQSGKTPVETYAHMWKTLLRGEIWQGELENRRKDGSCYTEHALISPIRQPDGQITHYLAIKSDITGRKANEAELDRYRNHLEDLIKARTSELVQARDAAESANRAKSVFLANMSHELRTPLNAILGFAQLMERDQSIPPQSRANLHTINKSGQHLLSLINDVLEISRIESGRLTVTLVSCDLHDLLHSLAEVMTLRARAKGLEVKLEMAAEVPHFISTDIGKLRQILLNLLSNAIKYTERGTVSLRVRPEHPLPQGAEAGTLTHVRFEVADSGVGIAQEDLERIFQPFFQTEYGIRLGEGTGLGLTISREYAHLLGGELQAESTPTSGSVFHFTLPVTLAEGERNNSTHAGRVVGLAPGQAASRILVAEDNPANQQLLNELLSQAGFQVRLASNGAEAVDLFQSWQPHFIWMDMRMPVLDGYAATRAIRALPGGGEIPIVALTASAFSEDREAILAAGCNELVAKPVREEQLFGTMQQLLGTRFVYADSPTPLSSPAPGYARLESIPPGLLLELSAAADALDLEESRAIVERMSPYSPEAAQGLRQLINEFRFDEITALCSPAKPGQTQAN